MKTRILLFIIFLNCVLLSSQVPQGFNYQAIARSSDGKELVNASLLIKVSILSDTTGFYVSGSGTYVWEEQQAVKTNALGLFTLNIGNPLATKIQGSALSFSSINWKQQPLFIGTKINNSGWKNLGTSRLWAVPYSMVAGELEGAVNKLEVIGEDALSDEALFEVKRKDGQTMFAVYNHGVRVYMPLDTLSKAKKGGFAIGGFDNAKGIVQDYFVVNPDSIRAYIDTNPAKAKKGGFAIGGFDKAKGNIQDFMTVSKDSIRMFIDDTPVKAKKGGFAIGGFDKAKAGNSNFLNVSTDISGIINPSQNRILWYPLRNAFLTGKVLIENQDSVGENSFASGYESKGIGSYSQAMGFMAIARGIGATSFGYKTIASGDYSHSSGEETVASGPSATAIGLLTIADGWGSFAAGVVSSAFGTSSIALGIGAQAIGTESIAIGYNPIATGEDAVAIGPLATALSGYESALGSSNTLYTPLSVREWRTTDRLFVIGNGNPEMGTRSNAVTILKNGRIGLQSVENPTYALELPNNTNIGNGQARAYSWTTYSDSRLKENQIPISYGIKEIMRLIPKEYLHHTSLDKSTWSSDNAIKTIGLVAQDVFKIIPEAVSVPNNDSPDLWGLDYDKFIPVLVKAIQEQQEKIESYKSENDYLKSQLRSLQEKVNQIEAMLEKGGAK